MLLTLGMATAPAGPEVASAQQNLQKPPFPRGQVGSQHPARTVAAGKQKQCDSRVHPLGIAWRELCHWV